MKKLNRINMYAFKSKDVKGDLIELEEGELQSRIITINDNAITRLLERHIGRKFKEEETLEMMIKVMLPSDIDEAKKLWMEGITFRGQKYFGWLATVNDMKKDEGSKGKCLTTFVREDYIEFFDKLEDLISLGKFKEMEKSNKSVCINKDITSRISLAFGTSYYAGEMPNVIVLPSCKTLWEAKYKVAKKHTEEIDGKETIDYTLEDEIFKKDLERFDGGGIATPEVFEQIGKHLGVKYPIEFAIIRNYAVAIKGLITKFDIIKYLNVVYKEKTDFCKKVDGVFYLKDMWEEWRPVTSSTLLLNESMVKLAKQYKDENWDTVLSNIEKVDDKYREIINGFYVTKINKPEHKIKDYIRTNYQFISALALTKKDILNLSDEDTKAYKKIVNCFEKKGEEWKANLDYIRIFYNNIIDSDDMDEDIEAEIEDLIDKKDSILDKTEALLNVSNDCINLAQVRKNLSFMVEKKCRELALGKFHVKGNYRYIAIDPIEYMSFAMTGNLGDRGLGKYEFYSADVQEGEIRTIGRNPLCYWGECHNISFKNNSFLQNWLSPCKELIYFSAKDDIFNLLSGADADGDAVTVVDNEIIRKGVVGKLGESTYLINPDDGSKEELIYNKENRFLSHYKASGNLIGRIALKAANVNAKGTKPRNYIDLEKKEFFTQNMVPDYLMELNDEEKTIIWREKQIEDGILIKTRDADNEIVRESLKKNMIKNNLDSAVILRLSMSAIDAPKSLKFPSKEEMSYLENKKNEDGYLEYNKKEYYLQYDKSGEEIKNLTEDGLLNRNYKNKDYNRVLDYLATDVEERLLKTIEKNTTSYSDNVKVFVPILSNSNYNQETYEECKESVECLYKQFNKENVEIYNNKNEVIKPFDKKIKNLKNEKEFATDEYQTQEYDNEIQSLKMEKELIKKMLYKGVIAKYTEVADNLVKKYNSYTVSQALANTKTSERFIIDLFIQLFNNFIKEDRVVYKEVKEETEDTIRFMHKNYIKIVGKNKNNNVFTRLSVENKKNCGAIPMKEVIGVKKEMGNANEVLENNLDEYFTVIREDKVYLDLNGQKVFSACKDNSKLGQDNLNGLETGAKIKISAITKNCTNSMKVIVTELIK